MFFSFFILLQVIDGFDVLDQLEKVPTDGSKKSRPLTEIKLTDITIHANPLAN